MDQLKHSKTFVEVAIENNESYHIGGSNVSGTIIFTVNDSRGVELQDLAVRLVCDIDISFDGSMSLYTETRNDNKIVSRQYKSRFFSYDIEFSTDGNQTGDEVKHQNFNKTVTRKLRLYNQEYPIALQSRKLKPGQHTIPFSVPLPAQHPTLPPSVVDIINKQTFGNIDYYIKVKAKRSTTSWFSKSELKAKCPFTFVPLNFVPDPNDLSQILVEREFTSFFDLIDGKFSVVSGILKKLTPTSIRDKNQKRMALYCTLKMPAEGLRQDRPNRFGLVVRLGDNTETVMVKWITLSVETVVTIKADSLQTESVITKTPILQKMPLASGGTIDLTKYLGDVTVKQTIIPSFITPLLSHSHRLRVELTVVRDPHSKTGNEAQVIETVPLVVISPHVAPKAMYDDPDVKHAPEIPQINYPDEKKRYDFGYSEMQKNQFPSPQPSENSQMFAGSQLHQTQPSPVPSASSSQAGPSQAGPYLAGPSQAGPSLAGPVQAGPSLAGPSNIPIQPGIVPEVQAFNNDSKQAPPPSYEEST